MFSSLHRRLVAVGIFYVAVARRGNGETEPHECKTESWMSLLNILRSSRIAIRQTGDSYLRRSSVIATCDTCTGRVLKNTLEER
jgi:hypothetical protein